MDPISAKRVEKELIGKLVGSWEPDRRLGNGKSAVVFHATRGGQEAALKVFDPDLVERLGETVQLTRIEREKRLIGESHENLVQIFDGGKCNQTGYLYVAMACTDAPDLEKVLQEVPRDRIRPLIAQLAAAAEFLDGLSLVHRDIKPSNIAVSSDFQKLTLLDLGVLRPFGEAGLTDIDGQQFVGTLQYSSPEFLFRKEIDSPDGWRALTFYQIGAVLHDLLTRQKIFEADSTPYARLVEAVKYTVPDLKVPGADPDLVALAGSCLAKDPATRLHLVTWRSFSAAPPKMVVASLKDRVIKRQAATAAPIADCMPAMNLRRALNDLVSRTSNIIRDESVQSSGAIPPVEVHDHPQPDESSAMFRAAFPRSPSRGIPNSFAFLFRISMLDVDASLVEITVSAAVSGDVRQFPPEAFSAAQDVYKGPYGEELVKNKICLVLYAGVEAAMGEAPVNPDEARALTFVIPYQSE